MPKAPRGNVADPIGTLSQKAADIAQKHNIVVKSRTRRSNTPVTGFDWNGSKVDRVSLELVIECDTERFIALLKDFEASPDITGVSSVRMTKVAEQGVPISDSTIMRITLVPEMWVLPRSGAEAPAPEPASTPANLEGVTQ